MVSKQPWRFVASVALLAMVVGCGGGGAGGNGSEVKGRVTFEGTPVASGTIIMIPTASDGKKVSMPITNGEYLIPKESGPDQGTYRVEIYAFEPIAATKAGAEGDAEAESATRQIIPPQFNQETTLELEVNAAEMQKDFEL